MRILALIDLSPLSHLVTTAAAALARATGAELTLLHAARSEPVLSSGGVASRGGHLIPPIDMADRKAELESIVARLLREGLKVDGGVKLTDDTVPGFVLTEANTIGASYIVIGSHGHGRMFEALLGSVTSGVIRDARVPVVVVPARTTVGGPG